MYKFFWKRFLDILLSSLALFALLPLLLPICLTLLLTGEHEVLYLQKRIGLKNRPFFIWKFATMLKASPNLQGGLHTTRGDPRVLPLGRLLRKTKINELPQIVNILRGDMSIVGPRPLVDKTFAPYPDHVKEKIYKVRPGLTGVGSVVFRDEEELLSSTGMNPAEFYAQVISPYKGELELWYQDNVCFRTDCKLIFLTAWAVMFPKTDLLRKLFPDLPARPDALVHE